MGRPPETQALPIAPPPGRISPTSRTHARPAPTPSRSPAPGRSRRTLLAGATAVEALERELILPWARAGTAVADLDASVLTGDRHLAARRRVVQRVLDQHVQRSVEVRPARTKRCPRDRPDFERDLACLGGRTRAFDGPFHRIVRIDLLALKLGSSARLTNGAARRRSRRDGRPRRSRRRARRRRSRPRRRRAPPPDGVAVRSAGCAADREASATNSRWAPISRSTRSAISLKEVVNERCTELPRPRLEPTDRRRRVAWRHPQDA